MERSGKFIKKAIPVQVWFAKTNGVLATREGEVPYSRNDALLTGRAGERWTMERERFDATYAPVGTIFFVGDGRYFKRPIEVVAVQMNKHFQVDLARSGTSIHGNPDDWLVTAPDGAQWIVANDIFHETYDAVEVWQTGMHPNCADSSENAKLPL